MTLPAWRNWQAWAAIAATIVGGVVTTVGAVVGIIVALPAAYAAIEPHFLATHQFVRDENADQDASLLRARIDIARLSLPQMRAARIQVDDLRAKNPDSDLLRLQVNQLDDDITAEDARLRAMLCELNKVITPRFIC